MIEEYEKNKKKEVSLMRTIQNYGMGFILIVAGIFFLFRENFDLAINKRYPPDYLDKVLGGIFILYGIWRFYRGYKKNYFK